MKLLQRVSSIRPLQYIVILNFVVAAVAGALSIYLAHRLVQGNDAVAKIGAATNTALSLYADGLQMGQATRNILLDPKNPKAFENHAAAVKSFERTLELAKQQAGSLFPNTDAPNKLSEIESDFHKHIAVQHRIHDLVRNGDIEAAKGAINTDDTPLWRKYKDTILDYSKWLNKRADQTSADMRQHTSIAQALFWSQSLLLIAVNVMAVISLGCICRILRQTARELSHGSEQVASAAAQVSSSSQSLAQVASEQAASLEETSSSTEEISSMTRKNVDNSEGSAKFMADVAEQVDEGNRKLSEMVASMKEINDSSEKISRIIKTIDGIAFQTNILALNAAVEAARAGEAGMGFAVVSDEVRNLAQRCAQAAQDTTSLIEESVTKSQEGGHKLDEVARAISAITANVEKVKTCVDEVHVGSQEQARGLDHINHAVLQMEQLTQKTAASAEQSAAAGEELNAQADTVHEMVCRLTALLGSSAKYARA